MVTTNTEELAAGIQFVVDGRGNVTSVVLSPDAWQRLVARLEEAEDRDLLSKLAPQLAHGPGSAVRWSDVEGEWG